MSDRLKAYRRLECRYLSGDRYVTLRELQEAKRGIVIEAKADAAKFMEDSRRAKLAAVGAEITQAVSDKPKKGQRWMPNKVG